MRPDRNVRIALGGCAAFLIVLAAAALYGGNDGGPLSMATFSVAFAAMIGCLALGGLGAFDPDIPHERLKMELPRWAWVVILIPFAAIAGAITWWTYAPPTPLDYPNLQ